MSLVLHLIVFKALPFTFSFGCEEKITRSSVPALCNAHRIFRHSLRGQVWTGSA